MIIVYLNLENRVKNMAPIKDFSAVFSVIKKQSPTTVPLCADDGAFSGYNNRLMVNTKHITDEPLWKDGIVVYCDGWISPQSLIQEKFLEVN
jgi:hypothetical protein